ncbi:MAG: GNAT family N-acetyltransferase [Saprospiraceae bacterium]|nr:GNAT family N-acetyltransferase [Saprospiraceae bacterium]
MISKADIISDFSEIHEIINEAAKAYQGVIPSDRWKEPYMSGFELQEQIRQGVEFWKFTDESQILGVMGIQDKVEVTLIRHAYVRTRSQNQGIGGSLLKHLRQMTVNPILIGTWAAAHWAIDFYRKHGFEMVNPQIKSPLLQKYWNIPDRQIETSVVLASNDWF